MKTPFLLTTVCALAIFTGCDKKPTNDTPAEAPPTPAAATSPEASPAATEAPVVTLESEAGDAAALPDPVAMVDGKPIGREEFEKTLNDIFTSMGMQPAMLPPDQRALLYRQFVEDMVVDKLIDQASGSATVTPEEVDEEIAKISEQYGSQERFAEELATSGQNIEEFKSRLGRLIRQRKWMESQVPADSQVTDEEVTAFYSENKAEFDQPELVRASHVLIRLEEGADDATVEAKKKEAEAIAARAKKGEDFSAIATELSEDPTAKQNSGDLDFFPKDRMVPEFAEVAFVQEIDSISEPVRTRFGWHVIKVTDKKAAQTLPLEEVKADIAEFLKEGKQQKSVDEVIQKLRSQADVKIFLPEPPKEAAQPADPASASQP